MSWIEDLNKASAQRGNLPKGDGWKKMVEILEESPFGQVKTRELINLGLKDGTYEVHVGSESSDKGHLVRRFWYRKKT